MNQSIIYVSSIQLKATESILSNRCHPVADIAPLPVVQGFPCILIGAPQYPDQYTIYV